MMQQHGTFLCTLDMLYMLSARETKRKKELSK